MATLVPFILEGMLLVIGFNKVWGVDLSWFPGIVCFRIALPFD